MNKKKLYESIMESVSKELQNILQFDNSNIFDKEESQYNDSKIIDNYTYKTILEKLKNAEQVSEEEYEYVHQSKYKINSYDELKNIIKIYSKINPTGSLNWIDTFYITNMSLLFENTKYNGDISEWDVSNVTNMQGMFWNATLFNQPIGDWDVSNVTNMSYMFYQSYNFNQPIGDWDVSNVTNMTRMFKFAESFNQPIGVWNVSNLTDMYCMFEHAKSFNQDISKWVLTNFKYNMFIKCPIKEEYKPKFK